MYVLIAFLPYIIFISFVAAIINKAKQSDKNNKSSYNSANRRSPNTYVDTPLKSRSEAAKAQTNKVSDSAGDIDMQSIHKTSVYSTPTRQNQTRHNPTRQDNGVTHMMNKSVESNLRDDRNNDWLAKQLREEKRSLGLMREMFDLKTEHANNCEAEMLKRFHEDNHGKE